MFESFVFPILYYAKTKMSDRRWIIAMLGVPLLGLTDLSPAQFALRYSLQMAVAAFLKFHIIYLGFPMILLRQFVHRTPS